ncbi:MAG: 6-pyruvoyl-tetrahydropterin synthase-related protein, partial [Chloroflexota bacterium]|nr:6-pyruvoyl-tetrahydropterin synthase-related protein [Chloroflexota bacterium]
MHNKSSLRVTICALLLALLAAAPLWGPGMVNTRGGGDSPFLLQRTLDMAENLRHGIFPARWMAHAAYDLGCPFFNHYAALPYYLSGGLTAAGISPLLAIQFTQTLGFVLAALAMALWARRLYTGHAAVLLATVAYTCAPFHLVNVYVRGDSLSEFYAFVWYPLILWTLDRLAERATRGRIAAAALAYGALILTHNVSALIFSPFALLYVLVARSGDRPQLLYFFWGGLGQFAFPARAGLQTVPVFNRRMWLGRFVARSGDRRHAGRQTCSRPQPEGGARQLLAWGTLLAPFILGILLTAWFWLPAIGELGYGQLGPEFTAGYFHYSNHFRGLDLVQPALLFDYSVAGTVSEAGPFAMGLVQTALALIGAGVLVKSRKSNVESQTSKVTEHATRNTPYAIRNTHYAFLLVGLIVSTLMITPLSAPLWEHLPLLATTQFPWRFLSVQALFTAAVTGVLGTRLWHGQRPAIAEVARSETGHSSEMSQVKSQKSNGTRNTLFYILLLVSLCAATLLSLHPDRLLITAADVTWDNLLLYESFTGNIGTTIRYEYLPRDVSPRLYISEAVVDGVDAARPLAGGGVELMAELLERTPIRQTWRVIPERAGAVTFPLNWWPGWQAEVDGAPVEASPLPGSGRLTVNLAAGEHTVTL